MNITNCLRSSFLTLVYSLLVSTTYAQDSIPDYDQYLAVMIDMAYLNGEFDEDKDDWKTTFKTGDNDAHLKGVLKHIFSDSTAKYKYLGNPAFYDFKVTTLYYLEPRIPFTVWIQTIQPEFYPPHEFVFIYKDFESQESLHILDMEGNVIRFILIGWDDTYDGVSYSNIRFINDSAIDTIMFLIRSCMMW